jgi:hypothetical protein
MEEISFCLLPTRQIVYIYPIMWGNARISIAPLHIPESFDDTW